MCDASCGSWSLAKICSHTLAVAETNAELSAFLQWYVRSGTEPNITTLAMQGLPSGRGKKGGKPKRKQSRVSSPAATISQSYHSSQFTGCITGGITPSATSEIGPQLSLPPLTHKASAQPQDAHSIVPGIPCAPPPLIPAGVLTSRCECQPILRQIHWRKH